MSEGEGRTISKLVPLFSREVIEGRFFTPSGTEPLVRVMVEAATQAQADGVASRLAMLTNIYRACGLGD